MNYEPNSARAYLINTLNYIKEIKYINNIANGKKRVNSSLEFSEVLTSLEADISNLKLDYKKIKHKKCLKLLKYIYSYENINDYKTKISMIEKELINIKSKKN